MAAPLSPTPSAALNYSTPSGLHHETYYAHKPAVNAENRRASHDHDADSPAYLPQIKDEVASPTPRGPSPPKPRPGSRIISGSELSPLKLACLQAQTQNQQSAQSAGEDASSPARSMPPPPLPQSPRKAGPIKRFPVKVSQPGAAAIRNESPRRSSQEERRSSGERPSSSLQDVVRENEGLKHAIEIFEDEVNAMHDAVEDGDHEGDHTLSMGQEAAAHEQSHLAEEEHSVADDTMVSTFSAFNPTMLTQMRSDSPTKFSVLAGSTPRASGRGPEGATPSRTPRGNGSYDGGNTTNLMDFTEQMRYGTYGGAQPTPSRRGGGHMQQPRGPPLNPTATPQRNNLVNLLDFDIPPAPTPRSIPTITPRELESLKSGFLSEISSLKASLSGKEAEVLSLKTAVGDAEKRVGECMEQLRDLQATQESLQTERDSWERRGREMEAVLRKVKEEIVISTREREELEFKLDEAEKRREAAEMMAQEAESKMAGMRAGPLPSNKEVEIAVERVARELHGLYKSKHETKVAALKKSYEHRWEKQVRKLQAQVDQLSAENDELRHANSTISRGGIDPARLAQLEAERARDAAQIRELEAEVEKVEAVLKTVQADNAELRVLLERERVEKGELVMLAEEMMNMQSFVASVPEEPEPQPPAQHIQQQQHQQPIPMVTAKTPNRRQSSSLSSATTARTPGGANGIARSNSLRISSSGSNFRASGLRAPGAVMGLNNQKTATSSGAESRIGRMSHERTKSAAGVSGMPRPGSGQGLRSGGIMSSIEKMGSYHTGGGGVAHGYRRGE
ncbi:hypothetical protein N657DRAFT_624245 [Parathielavia appendiculata]|uniref:Uncharacterized protein n=1 Tax=Parathielavia appendiculata TaxID=2587402 RepID=A0AAN6Z0Q3_9PEZI|nr:hypothetical protein N657DRAFT_624245 [Parathielavia appendiculata]